MSEKRKYIVLISVHGLIRGNDMELGRDADTGGQVKYVIDLAKALSTHQDVEQVDLFTRRIVDPAVSEDYSKVIEQLTDNARIVRIEAGPEEYIAKEQLWDFLDTFTDNIVDFLQEENRIPSFVHSHYADAGYVGVRLSNLYAIPLVHTGHSLGRDKRKQLLAKGFTREEIELTYNIKRRIDAEEETLANADMVITSTHNEIEEQYSLYNFYDPNRMTVIPPGTDMSSYFPPKGKEESAFKEQLPRFWTNPDKPVILALSRPDERKNILTLIETYGESERLQELANLLIVAGNRDDIRDMDSGPSTVLTNILYLIDTYDLYGKVAIPKYHAQGEVPAIYRLAASLGGVFINPALTEPFGLTLLEAAASGLPVVATENGGPVDIIKNCKNGVLVDPLDQDAIAKALLSLLENKTYWKESAENGIQGVRKFYSWQAHVEAYLEKVKELKVESQLKPGKITSRIFRYRDRAIISDIDQTLVGNPEALARFYDLVKQNKKRVTFGIATGRRIDSALRIIKKHHIPRPDVLISSLGTRIHYGNNLTEDTTWADHVDHDWNRKKVLRVLKDVPGLELQSKKRQSSLKVSYYYNAKESFSIEKITSLLRKKEVTANVILSFGQYLDIIPSRASKGQALRYVSQLLDIPLENMLVAGGSGADEDMLRGNAMAVVVGNRHGEELSQLTDQDKIYFSKNEYAEGIIEAIDHYDFFAK
jgi:sucrose-phosphate synthase